LQIDSNNKYQDRVRKAIANRPRNAVVGGPGVAVVAAEVELQHEDAPALALAVADEVGPPQVAALRAPPNVNPPEQWSDAHMNWRHPLTFVFVLNGPLTFFHPSTGHRQVCEFLKKVPRSGPSDAVRPVSRDDNRRSQRAAARGEERFETADQNGDLLQLLQASRCTFTFQM
jgi:hypothetical protein